MEIDVQADGEDLILIRVTLTEEGLQIGWNMSWNEAMELRMLLAKVCYETIYPFKGAVSEIDKACGRPNDETNVVTFKR